MGGWYTEFMFEQARRWLNLSDSLYRSMSGADAVDAELYRLTAKAFRSLGMGVPMEEVIALMDAEWRKGAIEMNLKVANAAKFTTGPMQGQSCIHYKYAGPDRARDKARHIRAMHQIAVDKFAAFMMQEML